MKKSMQRIAMFILSLATVAPAKIAPHQDLATEQAAIDAKQQYVGPAGPYSSTTCSFTYSSGDDNKFMKYCVTANGNIAQFQNPIGHEYIATTPIGEGYGVCDVDASKAYYDYAGYGDSGNWQAPVTVSSSPTSVKISRTTTDGIYTLTQTITQNGSNPLVQVTMALRNNSTTARHVGLLRYADVDANGTTSNNLDYTKRTAFAYENFGYGLQIQYVSGSAFDGAYSQDVPGGPAPCNIFNHVAGPLQNTDGSIFAQYDMHMGKKATGTVAVSYKAF
jgi:hypothetical protein